jgi:flagellin-like hook-associated protein FlgL
MRVTSNMMYASGIAAMQTQQQELLQAQAQSSSGLRIQKPSDDPSGAYRHMLFSSDLSGVQSLKRTVDLAAQRLVRGDVSVGTVHDSMMQGYELAMQFSHGTAGNDPQVLKGAATSALALYQNIMTVANTTMDGVPLFGGSRTVIPFDDSNLQATDVRVQSNGKGSLAAVPGGFVANVDATFKIPEEQVGVQTLYSITPSTEVAGAYDVDINGARQSLPVVPTVLPGVAPYLELGNGVTFDLGGTLTAGDTVSFGVIPDGTRFKSTPTQLLPNGATKLADVDVTVGFSAKVAPGAKLNDLPLSLKISYLSTGEYSVNTNGIDQAPITPTPGQPPYLDLGNGITVNLVGKPNNGDVFYFEVVPRYQGGAADRPIQVSGGKTLPGNVTGAELVEGKGSIGQNVNIFGALAALRGALSRGDSAEVAVQLNRLDTGRAQTSDFQSMTGVRSTQMEATASILAVDETTLQTLKANNNEADMFAVMSHLQQATQTMQLLTATERQVLNLSLLDFIR